MENRTVLLVDDHATTRKLVRLALERAGFTVHEAKDGATAALLMQQHRPAVVLQDLVLPDVDGFLLASRLRALAGSVPVRLLAFSGLVSNLDAKRISAAGFDDVIAKPIAPARLVALVETHCATLVPASETFGAGKRLLIVDDDPLQLQLATFHLLRLGFQVDEAHDGQHALELAYATRPDIVVSDVLMPRLDGFGLASAMRRDEALNATPLILITSSYLEPSDRELARRAGADEFVLRTPALEELVLALRTVAARGPRRATTTALQEAANAPENEREHARRTMRQLERQVVQNSELMRRCSLLSAELTILTSLSEAVLQQRDTESALVTALSTCFDAINTSFGALYLLDRHRHLRVRALGAQQTQQTIDNGKIASFYGHEGWLRELVTADTSVLWSSAEPLDERAAAILAGAQAKRAIVVPLVHLGVPLGALFMATREEDQTVELEQWRAFAQGIANQITQSLALAESFRAREVAEREADQQQRLAREQAAVWRALVDHAPDVVMHLDLAGRVRFINRAPWGVSAESLRGKYWFELMSPEYRSAMRETLAAVLRDGQPRTIETEPAGEARRLSPVGAATWIESHLGPVRASTDKGPGEVVGALVVQRDVSMKKQTEAQLIIGDRMASVGTLAAGVAHEINNPLASVMANLDLAIHEVELLALPQGPSASELSDELRDAREAAERVRRIVRDLKIFSRADDDKREPVDVTRVLDSALRMAWNEVRHRARLIKTYAPVPRVLGNEARLGQVFLNLIVNAAQAIEEGAAELNEVHVSLGLDGQGRVFVSIRDTGVGIPTAIKARLFSPFVTTKPAGVGTGLGLSICHRIVSAFGGSIEVASEPGEGAEFRVSLPAHVEPFESLMPQRSGDTQALRRGRVMVVDDEPLITQVVRRTLTREHDVLMLDSAEDALRLIEGGQQFDVILCDLLMPRMSGMDFHRALARAYPEQAERMVFFTGGAFTPRAKEFLERVPNHRLEKPVDGQDLRALINGLVR
ncbi:MAG: Sensor protein [Myxococcaceae bacterium]|nr:Sensor protein [Myxococcaceae bacterium]